MSVQPYDLAGYICPNGGPAYILIGLGYEVCQSIREKSGYAYQVKNSAAESIWFDANFIYRGLDTSSKDDPANPVVYAQFQGDRYGAPWAKRFMSVGEVFTRDPDIQFYKRSGTPISQNSGKNVQSRFKLEAHLPSRTFTLDGKQSRVVSDVLQFVWLGMDGSEIERYWYAYGIGLVEFLNVQVPAQHSVISPVTPSAPLLREVLAWFHEPVPPPVLPLFLPSQDPDLSAVQWRPEVAAIILPPRGLTLRKLPRTSSDKVDGLMQNELVFMQEPTTPITAEGYDWAAVRKQNGNKGFAALRGSWGESFKVVASPDPLPTPTPTPAPTTPFRILRPLPGGVITARFGEPRDYDGDGIKDDKHEGDDFALAPNPCEIGDVHVVAVADGIVTSVRDFLGYKATGQWTGGYGIYVKITHTWGAETYVSWYGHLSAPLVCVGQQVKAGDSIGVLGSTGNSTGYHCHLNIQHIGKGFKGYVVDDVIDPEPLLIN